jgi:putative thiamine transport system permease protein
MPTRFFRFLATNGLPTALCLLVAVPMGWSLLAAVAAAADATAWAALWAQPQMLSALAMSAGTGVAASLLSALGATWILARTGGAALQTDPTQHRLGRLLSPLLAVPHAAFAIGLLALIAPSGWLLRLVSPWATGLQSPPPWPTSQDPWGVGLVVVLVCKEIPFLLWAALAYLQRPDVAKRLRQELNLARTLGYTDTTAWWRVVWPQLLPRWGAPLLAVWAYGLTVVDVALVIGPGAPPTLAVLAWQWLQDADPATNAQGAAAAWLLAAMLLIGAVVAWWALRWPGWRARLVRGIEAATFIAPRGLRQPSALPRMLWVLLGIYTAVMVALLLGSFTGSWPFPALLPQQFTWAAWRNVGQSSTTLNTTLWLALASGLAALLWAVAWLEWVPLRWQQRAQPLLALPLVLPAVLWVLGQHQLALAWGLDASASGVWLAHTLACLPYTVLALQGPYQGVDPRLQQVAATLGHGRGHFLLRVKWPLLRPALLAAFAIGFAVSVAQYLPTLYVGAGRFNTVTTEAVNLAAGGQRSLTAAYAWLQWLLPVLVFALAARWSHRRWPRSTVATANASP